MSMFQDPYICRPLPCMIGSTAFTGDDNVGLLCDTTGTGCMSERVFFALSAICCHVSKSLYCLHCFVFNDHHGESWVSDGIGTRFCC